MGIGYLLHQSSLWSDLPNQSRNCRIFLIAGWFYIFVYFGLLNIYKTSDCHCGSFVFMGMMLDFFACGIIYKNYYGRSILCENVDTREVDDKWNYDEATHKYIPKSDKELHHIKQERENRFTNVLEAQSVVDNKQRIRAAVVIQRWWHQRLYEPPHGILFLRGQEAFYNECGDSNDE